MQINVGDIFKSSWGYEQTNVDFFVVVSITKKTITLQKVKAVVVEASDMRGRVVPGTEPIGKPFRRTFKHGAVKVDYCSYAYPWNGRSVEFTSYA